MNEQLLVKKLLSLRDIVSEAGGELEKEYGECLDATIFNLSKNNSPEPLIEKMFKSGKGAKEISDSLVVDINVVCESLLKSKLIDKHTYNNIIQGAPLRTGTKWSTEEKSKVALLFTTNAKSINEISEELKRKPSSVISCLFNQKVIDHDKAIELLHEINAGGYLNQGVFLSEEDKAKITEGVNNKLPIRKIAESVEKTAKFLMYYMYGENLVTKEYFEKIKRDQGW